MSYAKKEVVRTIQRGNRVGALMERSHYNLVKEFLLSVLEREETITINDLLSQGQHHFQDLFKDQTGWYLYNVKLDLEARGLITHKHPKNQRFKSTIARMKKDTKSLTMTDAITKLSSQIEVNQNVKAKYQELFHKNPLIVHSPGRINLIGEHTDYNNGYVMPAAIEKGIQCAFGTSNDETLIYSSKYKQFLSVDLKNIQPSKSHEWQNYPLGVIYRLQQLGHEIKPFTCVFEGNLPTGAGLSSSAALECGFALGLKHLFNLKISELEMIQTAQWAEHNFVGVKCGIMDQFASVMGKEHYVIQLDCRSLAYQYLPLELKEYCLLLCDTNVKHSLASSEYNTRREECEQGVSIIRSKYPDVESLRDVSYEMLAHCEDLLPEIIRKRCRYVVEENDRVVTGSKNLQDDDLEAFGKKMYETHDGLSKLYEVSCPELDFLVDFAKSYNGIIGSRMMGGGFGGCTINIIENALVGTFINSAKAAYRLKFNKELSYHVVRTGNGASVIENPLD